MEKQWADMTPGERRAERYSRWLSPEGAKFNDKAAEQGYKERVQRLIDALEVREPDRVPVNLPITFVPLYYGGTDLKTAMYDYEALRTAWLKFIAEFEMDIYSGPGLVNPGKMFEAIDYKLFSWPGHGLPANATGTQFVEGEYMMPDEYPALIKDPSDFWLRTYLPRIFGSLKPLTNLYPLTSIIEIPTGSLMPFTRPDVRAAVQSLLDAGEAISEWLGYLGDCDAAALAKGLPSFRGGFTKAPFDIIGDAMRGTSGIMMDMYRQPDLLLEALERITPLAIKTAVDMTNNGNGTVIVIPLHKGADGFMSEKQFLKFYWPTLKKVILGIVEEGILPILFAEGSYTSRLDIVSELPERSVMWWFDQTDIVKAKQVLGGKVCISGNVPSSVLLTGTPADVKEYSRKLIETVGKDGGYILTGGAVLDKVETENLRALQEAAKEYGVYKK